MKMVRHVKLWTIIVIFFMYIAGSKRDATTASIIDKDKNDDMIVMTKVGDLQKKGVIFYIEDHVWNLNFNWIIKLRN